MRQPTPRYPHPFLLIYSLHWGTVNIVTGKLNVRSCSDVFGPFRQDNLQFYLFRGGINTVKNIPLSANHPFMHGLKTLLQFCTGATKQFCKWCHYSISRVFWSSVSIPRQSCHPSNIKTPLAWATFCSHPPIHHHTHLTRLYITNVVSFFSPSVQILQIK